MTTAHLPDGREVDTASEEWRLHCLKCHQQRGLVDRHVATLQRMTGQGSRQRRADYLEGVARADGQEVAAMVQAEFVAQWERARTPPT